jgi:protein-S-isoprenylcysteine O-methyltransferase Ste14
MKSPQAKMWFRLVIGLLLIGLVLFLSAGTIRYWQAWVYLAVGALTCTLLTFYVMKDPILLENRAKGGLNAEQRPLQKIIVRCMGLLWIGEFLVPGLDRRFGWSNMPSWLSIGGDLLVVLSMWMVYRVLKENSFASATVEIGKEQKVITAGPYAIVRNPMYSSAMVYFVAMSLSLGSYWALIPSILMTLGFAWRLSDEEKFLSENLPGYTEYCDKVKYHLIPLVW